MDYIDENPTDEVYRIRLALLEEYGGLQGYFRHLDEVRSIAYPKIL